MLAGVPAICAGELVGDDAPTSIPSARTQIDDVVGVRDEVEVMLEGLVRR